MIENDKAVIAAFTFQIFDWREGFNASAVAVPGGGYSL